MKVFARGTISDAAGVTVEQTDDRRTVRLELADRIAETREIRCRKIRLARLGKIASGKLSGAFE